MTQPLWQRAMFRGGQVSRLYEGRKIWVVNVPPLEMPLLVKIPGTARFRTHSVEPALYTNQVIRDRFPQGELAMVPLSIIELLPEFAEDVEVEEDADV